MNEMTIETGSKIGIYGLGLTGQSVAKFLEAKGFSLHLFDDSPTESALALGKKFKNKIKNIRRLYFLVFIRTNL